MRLSSSEEFLEHQLNPMSMSSVYNKRLFVGNASHFISYLISSLLVMLHTLFHV